MRQRAKHLGPVRRRPMVLDAALEVFVEHGIDGASMASIARRAGITKPVLYDCFPGGKNEIVLALLDREEERILDHLQGILAMTRRMPVGEGIRLGMNAFLEYADINPLAFRLLLASGSGDPEISRRTERVTERIVGRMGERAMEIAISMDAPPVIGEIFMRSIVGVAYYLARWWGRDKPIEREVIADTVSTWMMKGLEGMVPAEVLNRGLRGQE